MPKNDVNLRTMIVLVGIVFTWTLFLPGVIAFLAGVETSAKIAKCLPETNESVKKLIDFNREKQHLVVRLKRVEEEIDRTLSSSENPGEIQSLFAIRNQLLESLKASAPAKPVGFFEAQAPYYLFVSYFALLLNLSRTTGWIRVARSRWLVLYTTFVYVLWSLPNWARNFLFHDLGRTIFSHSHIDISVAGFLSQELQVLGISFLIAATWIFAISAYSPQVDLVQMVPDKFDDLPGFLMVAARKVGRTIDEWQVASIILGFAFLPFTLFYFRISAIYGDTRYYSSALVFHFLWGVTWWIISMPAMGAIR